MENKVQSRLRKLHFRFHVQIEMVSKFIHSASAIGTGSLINNGKRADFNGLMTRDINDSRIR